MKKTILLSLLFGLVYNIQAQVDYYTLTHPTSQGYPNTSASATTLWTTGDELQQPNVPIGFDFYYGGKKYTTCTVGMNGAISFENNVYSANDLASTTTGHINMIAPMWDDLKLYASNGGYVAYETTGAAPDRIFKVSWKNISHFGDEAHDMSFILELKETSNEIEFYYGHCDAGTTLSASIGFNFYDAAHDYTTFVSVTPDNSGTNPTASRTTANNNINYADYPGNGKLYNFAFDHAYNDVSYRSITLADPRNVTNADLNYFNNIGATQSGGALPTCANFQGGDVWYGFTAPSTGAISIVRTEIGDIGDLGYAVHHLTGNTAPIYCDRIIGNSTHNGEPNVVGDLIAGDTYYIRMWDYGNDDFGITPFYVAKVEANDEAAYAIEISVNAENAPAFIFTTANNTLAMDSEHINGTPTCNNYLGGDVWYKFTAPATGKIKVHHTNTAGDWSTFAFAIYDSNTSNTSLACDGIYTGGATPFAVKTVNGLTAGQEYWLRAWDYDNNHVGSSEFYLTDGAANGIEDYQALNLKYYPNPATDFINVSAEDNMQSISIMNLSGQVVLKATPRATHTQINIANLPQGVYMMKVNMEGDQSTIVKIIKK